MVQLGVLVERRASPATATSYYPFTDQVGSVRTLVTGAGTVAATYTYSAYGNVRSTTGALTQPYQYGAGHIDTGTGLVKLGIRYYDPTHGRYTQPDPTGQEAHDYLYVSGDPVTLNDPNGDIPPVIAAIAWAAAGAGARGAATAGARGAAARAAAARAPAPIRIPAANQRSAQRIQREWVTRLQNQGYTCTTRGPCGQGHLRHVDYRRGDGPQRTLHIGRNRR